MDTHKNKRNIGNEYEEKAVEYLKTLGYQILEQNFRCRMGEIDIIGRDGKYLSFIEVKYRVNEQSGSPGEAVNYSKQKRITRTALFYMMSNELYDDTPVRFDVVTCKPDEIQVVKNAFEAILH